MANTRNTRTRRSSSKMLRIISLICLAVVFHQNAVVVSARFLSLSRVRTFPGDRHQRLRRRNPRQLYPVQKVHGGHQETLVDQLEESLQDGEATDNSMLFGTRKRKLLRKGSRQLAKFKDNLQERMDQIKDSVQTLVANVQSTTKLGAEAAGEGGENNRRAFWSAVGPSVLAFWASSDDKQILSFLQVYSLSLLGSSIGFYSFLYFISVGYALGITIPLVAALSLYQKRQRAFRVPPLPATTLWHSGLVILWGIRAVVFFLWREFVNWPALHAKIRQVSVHNAPSLPVKLVIWMMYTFLYVAMLSPCWFRIQQVAAGALLSSAGSSLVARLWHWTASYLPLMIQATGLALETLADHQKSAFKKHHRYEWCHVGLWKWSTHPNYLGEWIFWTGTYLGFVLFVAGSKTHVTSWQTQMAFCTLGYVFITTVLRGSIQSMGNKHMQKYGHLEEYGKFRQTHGLVGPKLRHNKNILLETVASFSSGNSTAPKEQQQPEEANTNAVP